MATASTSDDRVFLFRLQTLIIDGGTDILRNIFDQKLPNVPLHVFLANEKVSIDRLRRQKTITPTQYHQLYPTNGQHPKSADFDITLIICLLRNLHSLGFNVSYTWNGPPMPKDTSVEADLCRLKVFRNEIAHISSTTDFQLTQFETKWAEIENVLLRLNSSVKNPLPNFKQRIENYKTDELDQDAERQHQTTLDQWREMEKGLDTEIQFLQKDVQALNRCTTEMNMNLVAYRVQTDAGQQIPWLIQRIFVPKRKRDLRRDLITLYRQQHDTIQLSPLIEEEDTRLLTFYVKPDINLVELNRAHGRREEKKTSFEKHCDIFYKDQEPCREIYVTADAGFGKTMFSKRLVLAWCQAKDSIRNDEGLFLPEEVNAMKEFDFVFLVLLRDGSSECHIDDFIFSQLIYKRLENNYSLADLENILSEERCLVILDGLDEWVHPSNDCTRKDKVIPHRRARRNMSVLTTTRPWKLASGGIKASQIDQKLEIAGLGLESAKRLKKSVIAHFSGREDKFKVERFDDVMKANKMFHLAVIPILLMYMLCLFCDKIGLGKSLIGLYCNIVEMLLKRTLKKYESTGISLPHLPEYKQGDIPPCFRENKKCRYYYTLLKALGKLAYETLFIETNERMLVFDRSTAKQYLKNGWLDFCLTSGLLTQSKNRGESFEQKSKVSFSHKSVQELFAALHVYSAPDSVPTTVLSKCKSLSDILEMSKIFVFISGFNAEVSSLILPELMEIVNTDEITSEYRSSVDDIVSATHPLKQFQDMCISCFKEMSDTNKVNLCLQDVFIDDSCEQDQYHEILLHLKSSKNHNIRSVYIDKYKTGYSTLDFFFT